MESLMCEKDNLAQENIYNDYSNKFLFDFKPDNIRIQKLERKTKQTETKTQIKRNSSLVIKKNKYFIEINEKTSPFNTLLKGKNNEEIIQNFSRIKTYVSSNRNQENKLTPKKKKNVLKEQSLKKPNKIDLVEQKKNLIISNKLERLTYADFNNKIKISFLISNQLKGKQKLEKEYTKTQILQLGEEVDEENSKDNELTGILGKNLVKNVCHVLNVSKETKSVFLENKNQIKRHSVNYELGHVFGENKRNNAKFMSDHKVKIKLQFKDKKEFNENEFTDNNDYSLNKNQYYKLDNNYKNNVNYFKKKKKRFLKKIQKIFDSSDEKLIKYLIKSKYVISHLSKFRKIWDFIAFIGILLSIFIIPMLISFPELESYYALIFQILLEIIFIFDIILNFFTSYYDREEIDIQNILLIIPRYLKNRFLIDFIASFPVNLIYFISFNDIILIQFLNCQFKLRCLRWLSISRILKFSDEHLSGRYFIYFLNFFSFKLSHLYTFAFYFLSLVHITTCFFIFIGKSSINNRNWISIIGYPSLSETYLTSFYYNLVTIYTIGYGDIIPINIVEVIYVCVFMLISNFLYSYGISSLSQIFSSKNKIYTILKDKRKILEAINEEFNIPEILHKNLNQDLKNQFKKIGSIERYEFLESLPSGVKNELIMIIYRRSIKHQSYFRNQSYEFVLFVLPLLKSQTVQKGEKLYKVREYVEEMYLVTSGMLSLTLGEYFNNLEIGVIRYNQHFGDLFLQLNGQSPYDLICKSQTSDLLVLRKTDYLKIKNSFMESSQTILEESYKFLEILDQRRNSFIKIFNLWNNPIIVKKKLLQLNIFLMNEGFQKFFELGEDFQEAQDYLRKMEEEEIIDLYGKIGAFSKKTHYSNNKVSIIDSKNLNIKDDAIVRILDPNNNSKSLTNFKINNDLNGSLNNNNSNNPLNSNKFFEASDSFFSTNSRLTMNTYDIKALSIENQNKKSTRSKSYFSQRPNKENGSLINSLPNSDKKTFCPSNFYSKNTPSRKSVRYKKAFNDIFINKLGDDHSKKQDILKRENILNDKTLRLLNLQKNISNSQRNVKNIVEEADEKLEIENEISLVFQRTSFEILQSNGKERMNEKKFYHLKSERISEFQIFNDIQLRKTILEIGERLPEQEIIFDRDLFIESNFEKLSNPLKRLINNEFQEMKNKFNEKLGKKSRSINNDLNCPLKTANSNTNIDYATKENLIDLKLENLIELLKKNLN